MDGPTCVALQHFQPEMRQTAQTEVKAVSMLLESLFRILRDTGCVIMKNIISPQSTFTVSYNLQNEANWQTEIPLNVLVQFNLIYIVYLQQSCF